MRKFIFLLIFAMISAGVMLSGIAMKNSAQCGIIMLVLAACYVCISLRIGRRKRFPF